MASLNDMVRFSPSRTAWLRVGPGVGYFSKNHLGIMLIRRVRRVRIRVEI